MLKRLKKLCPQVHLLLILMLMVISHLQMACTLPYVIGVDTYGSDSEGSTAETDEPEGDTEAVPTTSDTTPFVNETNQETTDGPQESGGEGEGDGGSSGELQPKCGNNVLEAGEECDGLDMGSETCLTLGHLPGLLSCTNCLYDTALCVPVCGNGIVEQGEQCDTCIEDGSCDACQFTEPPICGDDVIENDETCEPDIDGEVQIPGDDYCDSNCHLVTCGNGLPDLGEACDDGNKINGDGCQNNCTLTGPGCLVGLVEP